MYLQLSSMTEYYNTVFTIEIVLKVMIERSDIANTRLRHTKMHLEAKLRATILSKALNIV